MEEMTKTYKQSVPAMRFIGKIGPLCSGGWGEWHKKGWFGNIEKAAGGESAVHQLCEDSDAYIGLMHLGSNYNMKKYWIGMFTAPGATAPDSFDFIDYPAQNFGVCWI